MKILILNWRDIKNPSSGGAEVLTHEMARRWVKWGNEVTQFSSLFKGAKKEEIIDGVKIIRRGNPDARYLFGSIHFIDFFYYKKYFEGKFDVVIDEIHGLPFFTPFFVKEKKVALICEVAGKIWDTNFPFPFNLLGKFVENNYFRFYKKTPFLTISLSTQKDLEKFGINKKNITILPMGISIPQRLPHFKKEKNPTLVFVGRIIRAKGIEDAIEVCKNLKNDFPKIKLWIMGRGEENYEKGIKSKVRKLGLFKNVEFLGFVSQEKKFEMLQRAHILLAPSTKEGFGLTVPEAGIVGTPAVAYNVEGIRDIIKSGQNGILVTTNPNAMSKEVKRLFRNEELYKKLQKGTISYSSRFNWDETAKKGLEILKIAS